jgi:hypothetical protein
MHSLATKRKKTDFDIVIVMSNDFDEFRWRRRKWSGQNDLLFLWFNWLFQFSIDYLNFELKSEIRKDSSNMNSGSSHVLNYRFFIMEFVYKDLNLSGSVVRWNKAIKNYIYIYFKLFRTGRGIPIIILKI